MQAGIKLVQDVLSITRHLEDLQREYDRLEERVHRFEESCAAKFAEQGAAIAALEATQAAAREIVKSEVILAMSDLRVEFAEREARRRMKALEDET